MKNKLLLLLSAASLLTFSRAHAQTTFVAGDILAVVSHNATHDSTTCSSTDNAMLLLTISSSFTGDSVRIVDVSTSTLLYEGGNTTGATTWSVMFPAPLYMPTITDNNIMGGTAFFSGPNLKVISGTDTIPLIPINYMLPVTNPCQYGNVSGRIYIDNNGDCAYNSGDAAVVSLQVASTATLTSPSAPSIGAYAYSGVDGTYSMTVQESWMSSYNVTLPSYYYFIFPITPCFSGAYTFTTLPQVNADFPLQCSNNVDVECYAGSPAFARPVTPFFMQPYVNNTGCDTVSGTLTLIKDSRVNYNAGMSAVPATGVSGDTLTWSYANLTNISGMGYWNSFISSIHLTPDATVMIGDTLHFRVYTNVPATDINAGNNDYMIDIPVVASYDPNIKEVVPAGTGVQGYIPATTPELAYTIHFQNTGTASAINISVIDTLSSNVDQASLKITGTSHTMQPEWLASNVVKFNFTNIYLPDSNSNEAASHGFVRFTVKPHAGLTPGTQIKNKGYIYFDSNPAVITNTALNTIAAPGSIATATASPQVKIYPNPARDNVYIENLQEGVVSIIDVNGSVVKEQVIYNNKTAIDISKLANGIYMIKTIGNDFTGTTKFVKQ